MRFNFSRLLIFLIVAVFLLPDVADARRRRSTSSGMARPTFSDTGPVTGVIRKRSSVNRTEYDYNWAARRDWFKDEAKQWIFPDKVRIKLLLREDLVEISDQLVAKIEWIYRHHSKTFYESVNICLKCYVLFFFFKPCLGFKLSLSNVSSSLWCCSHYLLEKSN